MARVQLFVYPMSSASSSILYHLSIFVHGNEYSYGGGGITTGRSSGNPARSVDLGTTSKTKDEIATFISDLQRKGHFLAENYNLASQNCWCFASKICKFLTGKRLPEEYENMKKSVKKDPVIGTIGSIGMVGKLFGNWSSN
ncbi:Desumoylating isopeptidase 1 [Pseudolycoriella hygida]|uniref:Desumoylating isopeptidase 1 n=1 Tax=Pseudolycoriella hygida TaxID=35572 RepID=A0A9Q0MZJ9_9DIPT|nr:Desumoylating isopeptidase 1 [Pseudolycoriella hygida]